MQLLFSPRIGALFGRCVPFVFAEPSVKYGKRSNNQSLAASRPRSGKGNIFEIKIPVKFMQLRQGSTPREGNGINSFLLSRSNPEQQCKVHSAAPNLFFPGSSAIKNHRQQTINLEQPVNHSSSKQELRSGDQEHKPSRPRNQRRQRSTSLQESNADMIEI